MFLGKKAEAEIQFEALLREDPDYELDPVLFPTEILDAFYQIKLRLAEELAAIQKAKEEALIKAKAEKEKKKKELKKAILEAARPVYLRTQERPKYFILTLVPFGAGQFQNRQDLKGWLFMGGELALAVANLTLWGISEYYLLKSRSCSEFCSNTENTYYNFQDATNVVAGVLVAAMLAGIIDAIVYYVRLRQKKPAFEQIDEDDVPPDLRKPPPDIPEVDLDVVLGISMRWP